MYLRLLKVAVRFKDLTQREILLPGTLVWRLYFQRPAKQVFRVHFMQERKEVNYQRGWNNKYLLAS